MDTSGKIPPELLFTNEQMKTMSDEEIQYRVRKIFATGKVIIPPRIIEEGKIMAKILEASWDKLQRGE